MRGPHPRLIRLAAARGAYLCLKSFGDRAPCPSAAKSGRTPWDSPRSHIDTVACCSPCRSALAASASTPSTPSVAGGTRLALQKACDVGRRWRGRAQRRATASASSTSASGVASAGGAARAVASACSAMSSPLGAASTNWRAFFLTARFVRPLTRGIYLHARRDTRRVYQRVKILCSALEVGWLMGLAAADGAYLQYSSSSVYRKAVCTAGAYVQKCDQDLRSRKPPITPSNPALVAHSATLTRTLRLNSKPTSTPTACAALTVSAQRLPQRVRARLTPRSGTTSGWGR